MDLARRPLDSIARGHDVHNARVLHDVIVLAASPDPPAIEDVPDGVYVIAADGGAEHATRLGLVVDLLVGDLDSVSPGTLDGAQRVERHPVAKDATDLELALAAALRLEPERIVVLGGSGGRLDHLLGALLVLAQERLARVEVDAQLGGAAVHVVRGERLVAGSPGELVSLFAIAGPAEGIYTEGLVYPLAGDSLQPGSSRGVSNVFADAKARISVGRGVLLAVRPSGSVWAGTPDRPPS